MKITLYYVVSQLQHFVVVIKRYTRKGDAFHSTSIHYWNVKIRVYSPNVWIYKYSSLSMVPTIVVLVFSSFFLSFPREETYIYIYIHTTCLSVHRSSKHGIWIFNTLYQCWCFPFVSLFLSSFLLCSFFLGKRAIMQSTERMDDVGDADLQVFYKSKGEKKEEREGDLLDNVEILFLVILYITSWGHDHYVTYIIYKNLIHLL